MRGEPKEEEPPPPPPRMNSRFCKTPKKTKFAKRGGGDG